MSNIALTATDFMRAGKLNFEGFTNVQVEPEFISVAEFHETYGQGKHRVLTKAEADELIKADKDNLNKAEGDEFVQPQRVVVSHPNGLSEVFVQAKSKVELEKAILDYDNKIQFKKTGKEIKEKLGVLKASLVERASSVAAKAAEYLTLIDDRPDQPVNEWEFGDYKDKIGSYTIFPYEKTYNRDEYGNNEVCDTCCKYNQLIYQLIAIKRDICECDTYINNLADGTTYTLSARELSRIGF